MDKLKMHSRDGVDKNIEMIGKLFPNVITERKNENGEVEHAIDFDMLKQELAKSIVEGNEERYQFTWPDKKKSILLSNSPIAATLRPCRKESVNFDSTENLYIEGDNLDVLKLLQETYLGKVKMIYIDPPYNTGNDFVYEDDFSIESEEWRVQSGDYDEQGNRMVQNTDSNGRFHTDWLNMIYPRLKVAKDLLTDDGVIFISIDDNEVENLKKICNEIFGEINFICSFIWKSKLGKVGTTSTISTSHEYILCFAKYFEFTKFKMIESANKGRKENLRQWGQADRREDRPSMYYPIEIDGVTVYPIREDGTEGRWRVGQEMAFDLKKNGLLELSIKGNRTEIYRLFPAGVSISPHDTLLLDEIGSTAKGSLALKALDIQKCFDYSKPVELVKYFTYLCTNPDDIILDFFSGAATTAHAVMQLNAEDGGNRKFIMVQLPEVTDEKSEAYKAGYKNICEIGKERIRRAGKKILEESEALRVKSGVEQPDLLSDSSKLNPPISTLDVGFRVLKLDSTNMRDVYYNPVDLGQDMLDGVISNIKEDRTPEDLLFQVMLELGILLSSKIQIEVLRLKSGVEYKYFNVADNFLIACFDEKVTDEVVKEIARQKPYYAVLRDSSMSDDSVATNFDQIFATFSPDTVRRVL